MFFEDAEVASGILDITLTSRNKNEASPIPMCGVPHRAGRLELHRAAHRARLQGRDLRPGGGPCSAKGLVRREVVRVSITPGMIIDEQS